MKGGGLRRLWGRVARGTLAARSIGPAATAAHVAPVDGFFYHTIDLPGHDTILGAWDLRGDPDAYLGFVDFAGKRVLEVGAANGYLSFELERRGANVVAYDLSPDLLGDIMEVPGLDLASFHEQYRTTVRGLNRAWRYAHDALGSAAVLVHGSAYRIPDEVGPVDVVTFGSILLHLRDPFSVLGQAALRARERIIVTDTLNPPFTPESEERGMIFDPSLGRDPCSWWSLSPQAVRRMLEIHGFGRSSVYFHRQLFRPDFAPWGHTRPGEYTGPEITGTLFTVVAER